MYGKSEFSWNIELRTCHALWVTLLDYWDAFQYFDKDNSGFITTKELGNLMRSLGENPTENELQSIINVVDMDENGLMDFQEFVQLMSKKNQYGLDATEAKQAFRIFDRDDRGYVLTSELRQAFRSLEEDIPESELDEILEDKYQSGNRKISFEGTGFYSNRLNKICYSQRKAF
ncbi:unnamed protein product [Porites evermanni]|uniref:EF-hand domain-containing protein n=1 Tax=Porites evermanni TaxID=104178 RepID=A0ABN8QIP0_9CNID|nr:unnamed protein product [Porites evermanni]